MKPWFAILLAFGLAFLVAGIGCGGQPDETATTTSQSLTCTHYAPTLACDGWAQSLPPTPAIHPEGVPQNCNGTIPAGWAVAYRNTNFSSQCVMLPPGFYATLGDWDLTANVFHPSFYIRSMLLGPGTYIQPYFQPNAVSPGPQFGGHGVTALSNTDSLLIRSINVIHGS